MTWLPDYVQKPDYSGRLGMTSENKERKYRLRRRLEVLRIRLDKDHDELKQRIAAIADKHADIDADREYVRRQWMLIESVAEEMRSIREELRKLG